MWMSTCVYDCLHLSEMLAHTYTYNIYVYILGTQPQSNKFSHVARSLRYNEVQRKAALLAKLQTTYSPQGHYPAQEMREWAPYVTGKPFAQSAGLNREGGPC